MRWLAPTIVVALLATCLAGLGPEGPGQGPDASWGPAAAEAAPVPLPRVRVPHAPDVPPTLDPPIPVVPDEVLREEEAADDVGRAGEDVLDAGLDVGEASTDDDEGTPTVEIVLLVAAVLGLIGAVVAWSARRGGRGA